jgi:hypothetical protein
MTNDQGPVTPLIDRLLPRLKYPQLFMVLAGLLLVDLLVPDPLPFVDEAVFAVLTLLVGMLRNRKEPIAEKPQPPKDVTAQGSDGPARTKDKSASK